MPNLMRCGMAFVATTLLAATTLAAQQASRGGNGLTTQLSGTPTPPSAVPAPNCPVSMRAQQRAGGDTLVARVERSPVSASRIHLTIGKPLSSAAADRVTVAVARVTVFGTGGKAQVVPLISDANGRADSEKSFNLTFGSPENDEVSTEMILGGFTSVQSIRIDALNFSDGSVWTPSSAQVCRVSPDLRMLVSAR